MTVKVHEPREIQLPPPKNKRFGNIEWSSGTKKMNISQMKNVRADAPWLGIQGKKIIVAGGIILKENQIAPNKSVLNNTEKRKALTFPPYMVMHNFTI